MGITKNYLRFVHEATFGVASASKVGSALQFLHMKGTRDRFVAVPANEDVLIWDLKTKQIINRLTYEADNAAEVSVIDCYHGGHPRTNLIAVGYANGHVRVFEYETGGIKVTFTGHRTAVSALVFDRDGSRLASGGKDCKIVLWDITEEKGLFSLKGHKNSITKLYFLFNEEHQKDLIVSSSIDTVSAIKFWDLRLQHCFCTLPGQASGVWNFLLLKNSTRLITGSTGPDLRVYSIEFLGENERVSSAEADEENELEGTSEVEYGLRIIFLGTIIRSTTSSSNRVHDLVTDEDETLILCHCADKSIEFYAINSTDEALKYAKKKVKKAMRKHTKRKKPEQDGDIDENAEIYSEDIIKPVTSLDSLEPQLLVDCEFGTRYGLKKLSDKVKSVACVGVVNRSAKKSYKICTVDSSNKIALYQADLDSLENENTLTELSSIESFSHRSDVKSLAISSDNILILSASREAAKLWRLDTRSCIATIDIDKAECCTFANAEHMTANIRDRFALIGTKNGSIQILDLASTSVIETIQVCEGPLKSLSLLPDRTGIVCGGEDGYVRFFTYEWKSNEDEGQKQLSLSLTQARELKFQEGITCVSISSNNNLLAVALLDSSVRIHFVDTFKYFLKMYGHKFPVTTMDISDDSTLLVTGSPDKNIKIWGLDFGDCHKSIFAHDEIITCVKFVPKSHYAFSCGRDKQIKQWDCDHFIKIQTLRKHQADVWALALSPNGKYLVTSSHDKSMRLYRRTEEILIPSEEDETERELEDERDVFEKQENVIVGEPDREAGFAAKMTVETVKSTDRLIEAIDVYGEEQDKEIEHKKLCQLADSKGEPHPIQPERNPLLMTAMTTDYQRFMLEVMRRIRSSELEEILLTLPFDYVRKLLVIVVIFLEKSWDIELMVRCATFLLKINFGQIAACPPLVSVVHKLKEIIMTRSRHLRECAGFNLLALDHLSESRRYHKTKNLR